MLYCKLVTTEQFTFKRKRRLCNEDKMAVMKSRLFGFYFLWQGPEGWLRYQDHCLPTTLTPSQILVKLQSYSITCQPPAGQTASFCYSIRQFSWLHDLNSFVLLGFILYSLIWWELVSCLVYFKLLIPLVYVVSTCMIPTLDLFHSRWVPIFEIITETEEKLTQEWAQLCNTQAACHRIVITLCCLLVWTILSECVGDNFSFSSYLSTLVASVISEFNTWIVLVLFI